MRKSVLPSRSSATLFSINLMNDQAPDLGAVGGGFTAMSGFAVGTFGAL